MADPATMTLISLGTTALGSGLQAKSASDSAQASARAGYYQAGVSMLNAQIAQQNAEYASVKGEGDAMRYGMKARQTRGEIIAGQSASGLDVNSGSAVDVRRGFDTVTKMDTDQIRQDAARVAYNYRTQSQQYTTDAINSIRGAKSAERAGGMGVLASIIGGASSVSSKWLEASKMGVFNNFNFGT